MISNVKIHYFTIGWNDALELCPLPVLSEYIKKNSGLIQLQNETPIEAACRRKCMLLILDRTAFHLDDNGNSTNKTPWCDVVNYVPKFFTIKQCKDMISAIKEMYDNHGVDIIDHI